MVIGAPEFTSIASRSACSAVFARELCVVFGNKIQDRLHESDDCRYPRPKEQQVNNTPSDVAAVEFVDADPAKQQGKYTRSDSTF